MYLYITKRITSDTHIHTHKRCKSDRATST